nr:immunoglobulin light chain junction region [Macaca mulatta]MOV77171.1 immunoglobulin light chain junction region [Macaca mulatta]MOX97701.1 immunoglobulin light chain junction region [Macaca mulatta]MOY01139.1 immunoglobulin light chain junction region [Macaca mulatta]MOY01425.1 immunoglobulin light chain junction region [Macaca mulatta]
CLQGYSSPFTF